MKFVGAVWGILVRRSHAPESSPVWQGKHPIGILLHELGFADRVIASELAQIVEPGATTKGRLLRVMQEKQESIDAVAAANRANPIPLCFE